MFSCPVETAQPQVVSVEIAVLKARGAWYQVTARLLGERLSSMTGCGCANAVEAYSIAANMVTEDAILFFE